MTCTVRCGFANIEELKCTEAEEKRICLVSEIQIVVAKESAEAAANFLFKGFD